MMMVFRMGLALFYIGFLNIFFSPIIAVFALVTAVTIYFIFPKQLHLQYHKIKVLEKS
jgi:CPA2 family monovalent cation:H+ antiporter-2